MISVVYAIHIISLTSYNTQLVDSTLQLFVLSKQLACNRNGTYFSKYFTNSCPALLWKCAKEHLWTASFSNVKHSNSWCLFCSKYKREKLCREIVSKYLGPPSKRRRPDFLKTPKD
jgi:hypothetical protein